jgi:hypothetical protein
MKVEKLTTLLVVDAIEPLLPTWKKLGYEIAVRVPDKGPCGFVILSGNAGQLMMQTRASLADDLPGVLKLGPSFLLYADVKSVDAAENAVAGARVIVSKRTTFYRATETWVELEGGQIVGFAQHES